MSGSVSFGNISGLMRTSESFSDLNAELNPGSCNKSRGASSTSNASVASTSGVGGPPAPPSANSAKANQEDSATNKPFGLETVPESAEADCVARPTSLNLNFSLNARLSHQQSGPKNSPSGMLKKPAQVAPTMSTLHEDANVEEAEEEEIDVMEASKVPEDKCQLLPSSTTHRPSATLLDRGHVKDHHQLHPSQTTTTAMTAATEAMAKGAAGSNTSHTSAEVANNVTVVTKTHVSTIVTSVQSAEKLSNSHTLDSLNELQVTQKTTGTPSMVSSGYGSQAVSSNTLSSD